MPARILAGGPLVGCCVSRGIPTKSISLPAYSAVPVQLRKLSDELENKYSVAAGLCSLRDAIHVPDIIHSTVMRVASEVEDPRSLAAGLAEISGRWKPATVKVAEISLVHEKHPYMHLDRVEGEVQSFSLPLG